MESGGICICINKCRANSTFAAKLISMGRYRWILDVVMGAFYLLMAGLVMYSKHFGTLELSGAIIYGMAGLLTVYGLFRIYLGIRRRNTE